METSAPEPGAKPQSGLRVIPSSGDELQRRFHPLHDLSSGIDLPGRYADAAETDLQFSRRSRNTCMSPASGVVNSNVRCCACSRLSWATIGA